MFVKIRDYFIFNIEPSNVYVKRFNFFFEFLNLVFLFRVSGQQRKINCINGIKKQEKSIIDIVVVVFD